MKDNISKKGIDFIVQPERSQFNMMLAKNPNYFGNILGSQYKEIYKLISDTNYEKISCLGYNPETAMMEATFSISRSSGYSGSLCTNGSFEHVRFYLDFHDGLGFIDQGSVAINVHDIAADIDCNGNSIFPLSYVASLKKLTTKFSYCDSPLLPTLRAILSWNTEAPANSPDWTPVWGNVKDCDVQMKPSWKILFPLDIDFSEYFMLAAKSPQLNTKQLMEITGVNINQIITTPAKLSFADLAKKYDKSKVSPSRFAFKTIQKMVKYPTSEITLINKSIMSDLNIDLSSIIDEMLVFPLIDSTKANVDYEELTCVGLNHHTESLVATISVKKNSGYSGDLCDEGSKEYVSFWIDWNNTCQWEYINTMELKVHDISMTADQLCYTVSLPIDTTFHKKLCATQNIVKVRSVLSWNTPPSTTDADKLEFYGNRVDTHIQIKPGTELYPGEVITMFNIIGGIDVAHVDDSTGLTKLNSSFAFNGLEVPTDAPFGGEIVLNGPSFVGYKYRIKITNLNDGTFYYANNTFTVVGHLVDPPNDLNTLQSADVNSYYSFLPHSKNTLNVLARFRPGTEDKLLIEMDIENLSSIFSKVIQMDNTAPIVKLKVNDDGDCTKYSKGQTITGNYFVNDLNISSWSFASTYGGNAADTANTSPLPGEGFAIATDLNSYPCGSISLAAWDKTIVDSQSVGHYAYDSYNICLQ